MTIQTWTFLLVGLTFALYIGLAFLARARTTSDFYVAGGHVSPLANGLATAADTLECRLRPRSLPKGARKPENSGHHRDALLAQSVEHSHGKAGVVGSIPTEGSTKWSGQPVRVPSNTTRNIGTIWRRSSVGQSIRLIIGRSSVQVRPPLQNTSING